MRIHRNWLTFLIVTFCSAAAAAEPVQSVRVALPPDAGPLVQRAAEILGREISERCEAKIVADGDAAFTVELSVQPGIGAEGFQIADGADGAVRIAGNDPRGLLYGVGKFLRTSRYDRGGFTPGAWRGQSVPSGALRGVYLATHFNNYFDVATDEEMQRYIDSLALWGTNSMGFCFTVGWYKSFDDPAAQEHLRKLKRFMRMAKSAGMGVGIFSKVNPGFQSAPEEIRAAPVPRRPPCGVNVCPSHPKGRETIVAYWTRIVDEFEEIGLDFHVYFPYDEGGCGCKDCAPWGARGLPKLCRDLTPIFRAKYPNIQMILGTWMFDHTGPQEGEWAGLSGFLAKDRTVADYLLVDAHGDFPRYPLEHGAPGGLPMVNFPDISMFGQSPWGGYGANPAPQRFQRLWNQTEKKLSGGFPYSEGIYEDVNKAICSQFYWNLDASADQTVKEYIAYEYSPEVVDPVFKAIECLERNHKHWVVVEKPAGPKREIGGNYYVSCFGVGSRIAFGKRDAKQAAQDAEEAWRLIREANERLTPQVRKSWRWRILYLRAMIDRELVHTDGWLEGPTLKAAFAELTGIYRSENARHVLNVPRIDDPNARHGD